jgi:hypothetical protein
MRLESLVKGELIGKGVENTDDLKAGYITPENRVEQLVLKAKALDGRIQRLAKDASVPRHKRGMMLDSLERQLREVVEEIDSIQRDLVGGEE